MKLETANRLAIENSELHAEVERLRAEVERLTAIEVAAERVIELSDHVSSSAQSRRLTIIALRAALAKSRKPDDFGTRRMS